MAAPEWEDLPEERDEYCESCECETLHWEIRSRVTGETRWLCDACYTESKKL
jgi:hypothetical protein